jgi:hypothetical protein
MTPARTPEEAYAACEAIAENRTLATARSAYGDGYRAAAEHIAAEIRANRAGCDAVDLERDLREAEVEARTMARVLEVAVRVVEGAGAQTQAADAVRTLVSAFFAADDLPPALRPRERPSGMRLLDDGWSAAPRARRAWARSAAR